MCVSMLNCLVSYHHWCRSGTDVLKVINCSVLDLRPAPQEKTHASDSRMCQSLVRKLQALSGNPLLVFEKQTCS